MHPKSFFIRTAALLTALALPLGAARAALLSPGSFVLPSLEAGPVGASLVATTNVSFNGVDSFNNVLFSGNLVSSVWSSDTASPYSGLTFTYQLFSSSTSANAIDRLTLNRFAGFQTDVGYNGAGISFSRATRTPSGDLIAFVFEDGSFLPTLTPGNNSPMLVIQTDSPVWAIGNASIIDGATANVPAFVPQAVPEPTTMALAMTGLIALAVRRKF